MHKIPRICKMSKQDDAKGAWQSSATDYRQVSVHPLNLLLDFTGNT